MLGSVISNPNLSEGADRVADRVGGQLRGDKEYPFSGVTNDLAEFGGRCRKAMLGEWLGECGYPSCPDGPVRAMGLQPAPDTLLPILKCP